MKTAARVLGIVSVVLVMTLSSSIGICQVTCTTAYTFQGISAADRFGKSVSAAGDINSDGYADVIVGAWGNDVAGPDAGQAYIYSGQTGATLHTFTGLATGDNFGWSVSDLADLNGDGFPDVIVGAPKAQGLGQAYVFSGLDGSVLQTFSGVAADDDFGWSVAEAGDVNMDGRMDFVIGAPSSDIANPGRAYVYSGLDYSQLYVFTGEFPEDAFGRSVAGAGDVNGDGHADVIVGAEQNDAGGLDAGRAYVYSGLDGSLLHTFTGAGAQHFFGFSVAGAVDLNTDGFDDLIIGATGAAATGKIYTYSGQDGSPLYDLAGEAVDDQYGWSVSGTGDVSGDGIPDVIVGAKFNDAAADNAGRAYLYSGANGALLVMFTGDGLRRNLGTSVSNAGDVNNDGIEDIIVGGPRRGAGNAIVYSCLPPPHIPTLSEWGALIFGALLLASLVFYSRRLAVQRS